MRETEVRCHELLLRLADRIPDRYLWRYRDWLAGDAAEVLARVLPATLVRERIALPDVEQRLVAEALLPLGADPAMVNAVLPSTGEQPRDNSTFSTQPPRRGDSQPAGGDSDVLVLGATLRGRAGVREVRSSWRHDPGAPKRVLLISATREYIALAGEVQRVLRALGDSEPRVEVLPAQEEPTSYHRAALAESVHVCVGPERAERTRSHPESQHVAAAQTRGEPSAAGAFPDSRG